MSHFYIPLRLGTALLCGWLGAALLNFLSMIPFVTNLPTYIEYYIGADLFNNIVVSDLLFILVPLTFFFGIGFLSVFVSRGRRNDEFFLPALFSGPLFLAGGCLFFLPPALNADAACPKIDPPLFCNTNTIGLVILWVIGTCLITLSSLIACLIFVRRSKIQPRSFRPARESAEIVPLEIQEQSTPNSQV